MKKKENCQLFQNSNMPYKKKNSVHNIKKESSFNQFMNEVKNDVSQNISSDKKKLPP